MRGERRRGCIKQLTDRSPETALQEFALLPKNEIMVEVLLTTLRKPHSVRPRLPPTAAGVALRHCSFFESRIHRLVSSLAVPSALTPTGNAFLRIDISIFVSKSVRFTYPLKIKTANLILERMQQRLSQYRELELFLL